MKKFLCICTALCLFISGCASDIETEIQMENPEKEDTLQIQDATTASWTVLKRGNMLSQEMAMLEGYVVMQDGDVRHNAGSWFSFLESCQAGDESSVTVAQYTQADSGSICIIYDLSFQKGEYILRWLESGQLMTAASTELTFISDTLENTQEPYDSYVAYLMNDIVLYRDLIAEPDYEGVTEIFLHTKEGKPPVKSYSGEDLEDILQLLMTADYMPIEPEDYLYGMKLLMTNRDGKELVIELDLRQGMYRYGMQTYNYGEISELFDALQIDQWPESVLEEFAPFLN